MRRQLVAAAVCDYLRAYSHAIDDVAMKCVAASVLVAAVAARSLLKRVQCTALYDWYAKSAPYRSQQCLSEKASCAVMTLEF